MGFRLVPKSVTLNDLEWRNCRYCALLLTALAFKANYVKFVEARPISVTKMYYKKFSFGQQMTNGDIHRDY